MSAPSPGPRIGACSWAGASARPDAAFCAKLVGLPPASIHTFTLFFRGSEHEANAFVRESQEGSVKSLAFADAGANFDLLFLGRSFRLYESHFYEALLRHFAGLARPSGWVALARLKVSGSITASGVALRWVTDHLGLRCEKEDRYYFYFRRPNNLGMTRGPSVYDWYRNRGLQLAAIAKEPADGMPCRPLSDLGIWARPEARPQDDPVTFREPKPASATSVRDLHPDVVQTLENAGLGTGYKASYVGAMLSELTQIHGRMDLLDHGSASGVVPMELLLDPRLRLNSATAVEPSPGGFTILADAYQYLNESFSGEFYLHQSRAEDFEYDRTYHAISFLGSLPHVKQPQRESVLQRAWDALEAGGLLIVYESIRSTNHRSYPYYDNMFERDELENLLGRFGRVHRFHETELRRCSLKEAGQGRVFRMVVKER